LRTTRIYQPLLKVFYTSKGGIILVLVFPR